MLRSYSYKLIRSPFFFIGTLATLAVSLYSIKGSHSSDALNGFMSLIGFESYRKLFILFAAVPFASNFADEWNSKAIINFITRKDTIKYACSNLVMCYLSATASVFVGMMIYIFVQSMRMPLFNPENIFGSYAQTIESGLPLLALMLMAFVFASSCGMWAVMGLTISAFFPSRYVALCAPFVFCYIIERFTRNLPDHFSLASLSKSQLTSTPLFGFLWSNFVFIVISAVCGVIFTIKVKWRVENELS